MIIRKARIDELKKLLKIYNDIIDHQQFDEYGPSWTKDVYPCEDDLRKHLEKDVVYVIDDDGSFAGAGIISLHEDEMYKKGNWSKKLNDDEVAVLHLFAIHPSYRRRGYASMLLKYIIEECRKTSKAIHIDVVKRNDSAFQMYEKVGFKYIGELEVYYEDTGNIIVDLMEYNL